MNNASLHLALVLLACTTCAPIHPHPQEVEGSMGPVEPVSGQGYDQEPVPTRAPTPTYPMFARDAGISGTVILKALVDESGQIQRIEIIQGITGLTDSAVNALRQWKFDPAMKEGQPVAAWVTVPMKFHADRGTQQH